MIWALQCHVIVPVLVNIPKTELLIYNVDFLFTKILKRNEPCDMVKTQKNSFGITSKLFL